MQDFEIMLLLVFISLTFCVKCGQFQWELSCNRNINLAIFFWACHISCYEVFLNWQFCWMNIKILNSDFKAFIRGKSLWDVSNVWLYLNLHGKMRGSIHGALHQMTIWYDRVVVGICRNVLQMKGWQIKGFLKEEEVDFVATLMVNNPWINH